MISTATDKWAASAAVDRAASFSFCAELTRRHAGNFYHGLKLMPGAKRKAMYAVYAWMRAVDDLADSDEHIDAKRENLAAFRRMTEEAHAADGAVPDGPLDVYRPMWPAVRQVFLEYAIALRPLHEMIEGQLLDQERFHYETFEQTRDYCYKVASTVGMVCLAVWGYEGGEATLKLAEARGIAFQLTNILRDLVEDAERGRVYLPQDELHACGYGPNEFEQCMRRQQADERFDRLMAQQLERVRGFYAESRPLERYLSRDSRATSWAMMRIYHGLLEKISRRPRDVLAGRVRLHTLSKLHICMRANWKRALA